MKVYFVEIDSNDEHDDPAQDLRKVQNTCQRKYIFVKYPMKRYIRTCVIFFKYFYKKVAKLFKRIYLFTV